MATDNLQLLSPADLCESIERQIERRTMHGIRLLRVEAAPDQLIVSGSTHTYHLKQLAILAVSEVLGDDHWPDLTVTLNIHVSPADVPHEGLETRAF